LGIHRLNRRNLINHQLGSERRFASNKTNERDIEKKVLFEQSHIGFSGGRY
jgi:hypothetical protein